MQENVLWYLLVLLGAENNISKVGQNWTITKGVSCNCDVIKDGRHFWIKIHYICVCV